MIIYIAGKYGATTDGERLKNTNKAIDMAIAVYKKGHYPLVPHLTHWIEKRMDYNGEPPRENSYWYGFDNLIIPKCDGILRICDEGVSKGADAELKLATSLHLHVFDSFEDIPHINKECAGLC